ncbi:MAG: hypothetical protein A2937_00635 [Candidatus Yonathbacteria bacterium RIFCSPLOWO2_01_FULL_47_33b]|uniref:Methyltransferase type 11 domain-containing protein n=1 Tax=Candidatus Yonathbacteria bacterium RIFCSPLOWO2_01_FULL_47_33b TaxID=1802727 RepID=A0A1G2SEC8_9BACT|nr:MAG: hypothetical protein A2937_00635 [Candidatus Yonathbacteria bacterium RIFCSPLOWO2_01_FULL_47_33b]
MENFESSKINPLEQGAGASRVFEGEMGLPVIEKIYGESAEFFAGEIKRLLPPRLEAYTMSVLDVGSHRGEFLKDLLTEFGDDYKFDVTAIDANETALKDNLAAKMKVVGNVAQLPFQDNAFDITVMRYVLPWNKKEDQKEILSEVNRVSNKYAIVQHSGAPRENSSEWQSEFHKLFLGHAPKLQRETAYFSSPTEIETWMDEKGINYQTIQDRVVPDISELFIAKYELSPEDAARVNEILADKDFVEQVAWVFEKKK